MIFRNIKKRETLPTVLLMYQEDTGSTNLLGHNHAVKSV